MSDHVITYDLQYPGNGEMDCHAAPDAPCRAVWDCDCESIHDFHVVDGVPHHYSTYDDGITVRGHHVGKFDDGACTICDWHENSDEDVTGTVRVTVDPVWEGDSFTFHAVTFPRDRLGEPLDISGERFDAWLAQVRRDAAREALDGYMTAEEGSFLDLHAKGAVMSAEACSHARFSAEAYKYEHYPEDGTP